MVTPWCVDFRKEFCLLGIAGRLFVFCPEIKIPFFGDTYKHAEYRRLTFRICLSSFGINYED